MRIPSGTTDQYIYFIAVDATDLKTREPGLSGFTVYRSRNGGAAAAMTTPTVSETDDTNMQGVYELLLDEDMTIGSGNDSEEMIFHITQAAMAPVDRTIELYRPKITAGQTLTTASGVGEANTVQIGGGAQSATDLKDFADAGYDPATNKVEGVKLVDTTTTNTDMVAAAPTAAVITDAVWDELQSGHTTAGTFGKFLDVEVSSVSGGGGLTQQDVADAMRLTPAGTVNTNSVDDKLDTLIALGEASQAIEVTRTSDVLTTGTQTGTSANTITENDTYWQITSVAGGIDAELVFNVGTDGESPVSMRIWGRFDSAKNRVLQPQAYNFAQAVYENLGPTIDDTGNNDQEIIRAIGPSNVRGGQAGTPGVDGDVRLRFLYDTTVSNQVSAGDDLYLDKVSVFANKEGSSLGELLEAITNANPQRNYPDSAIIINTENGQPGTSFGFNGTPGNPSNNLPDALALANQGGYSAYIIKGNSAITLDVAYPDWSFLITQNSTLDINGQNVDNSVFGGGTLSGAIDAAGATGVRVVGSVLNGVTGKGTFVGCQLPIVNSLICTGDVFIHESSSVRPGTGNPSINGNLVAGLNLSVVKWGGGIDISGLANDAEVTMNGSGSYGLLDAATTATVIQSGNARQVGGLPTGVVLTEDARVDTGQINDQVAAALATYDGPTDTEMTAAFTEIKGPTFDTTDTLEAIRDRGDAAWATSALTAGDILNTQMTESYAANGTAPTLAQAQFAIHQMLMQFGIAGTSLTVRQLDDTTTAFVVTLDDATNPTDASRV